MFDSYKFIVIDFGEAKINNYYQNQEKFKSLISEFIILAYKIYKNININILYSNKIELRDFKYKKVYFDHNDPIDNFIEKVLINNLNAQESFNLYTSDLCC